jgi:hypothetical protein
MKPGDERISGHLLEELTKLAGTAKEVTSTARVELRYKGVTYEALTEQGFVMLVRERLPDLPKLFDSEECGALVAQAVSLTVGYLLSDQRYRMRDDARTRVLSGLRTQWRAHLRWGAGLNRSMPARFGSHTLSTVF